MILAKEKCNASCYIKPFKHSLVGCHYGISFTGITLFIFGGIAEMSKSPPNPKTELLMSIAGPFGEGLMIFNQANGPKKLWVFDSKNHNDLWGSSGFSREIIQFVETHCAGEGSSQH